MDLRIFALMFSLLIAPSFSYGETLAPEDLQDVGLIEIVYPVEATQPYRDRRPKSHVTFQVQFENFSPSGYFAPSVPEPSPNTYTSVFGDMSVPMFNFAVGWKRNFSLLGLEAAAFYGTGSIQDSRIGERITLNLQKSGLKFAGYLDTLFKEPYVVPYGAVQVQIWNIREESAALIYERESSYNVGFQAGLLFQLNWIEQSSALVALNESGLNNTYIDLFMQQYGETADSNDPNLSSEFNWGIGLRLEY